jgi:hypothetical protein
MEIKKRRILSRAARAGARQAIGRGGSAWDPEVEIAVAIAMVARDPRYRVVVCARDLTSRVLANLDEAAGRAGVVLERRIRQGGSWDVMVRAG